MQYRESGATAIIDFGLNLRNKEMAKKKLATNSTDSKM
jgi:hypothetical protein